MRRLYHTALAVSMALIVVGSAHAATLLPNGKQQFTDANGAPYAGGTACFYVPGTTTPKLTWQDALETVPNTSPCVTLDSAGRAIIYGTGQYREELFDSLGTLVWDQLTQDSPTLTPLYYGATSTGTANAQVVTLNGSMQPSALAAGQVYEFIAGFTNTGATTLQVVSTQFTSAATAIDKTSSSGPVALAGSELVANNVIYVIYDGTRFQLLNNFTSGSITVNGVSCSLAGSCNTDNTSTLQAAPGDPAGTTSGSFVMMGLGSTCKLTTAFSTRVFWHVDGTLTVTTTPGTPSLQLVYGSGTAPANGTAATGTIISGAPSFVPNTVGNSVPFSVSGIATGLALSTAYWADLQLSTTGGTATVSSMGCTAFGM